MVKLHEKYGEIVSFPALNHEGNVLYMRGNAELEVRKIIQLDRGVETRNRLSD